jgi:membrane protein implicated in regulation of membrane protease activity
MKKLFWCLGAALYPAVLAVYFLDLNPGQPDPGKGVVLAFLAVMAVLMAWLYVKDRTARRQLEELRQRRKELQDRLS